MAKAKTTVKKPGFRQMNFLFKDDTVDILHSLARHYDCSMTRILTTIIRKTGKPRGRPRITSVKVGKIA